MISLRKSVCKILKPNYVFNFSTAITSDDLKQNEQGEPADVQINNENTIVDLDQKENEKSSTPASFAKLFRNSTFTKLGELKNRLVVGKIVNVVGDDLYIDFGGKFNCVCKKPEYKPENYVRNVEVILKLKDFEMASHFLGAVKHITLLEADARLIGLHKKKQIIAT